MLLQCSIIATTTIITTTTTATSSNFSRENYINNTKETKIMSKAVLNAKKSTPTIHLGGSNAQSNASNKSRQKYMQVVQTWTILVTDQFCVPFLGLLRFAFQDVLCAIQLTVHISPGLSKRQDAMTVEWTDGSAAAQHPILPYPPRTFPGQ